MTAPLLKEVRLVAPSRHDPLLDLYHNTRHASPRHASLRGMHGWQVRSPWLSRFDWVIDARLEAQPGERGPTILTKQRAIPRSIFVKAGWLDSFLDCVLPTLEKPVTVYMGNANQPLSKYVGALYRLLEHPMVHAVFCENKDLDVPAVTAMPVGLHPADMLHGAGALRLRAFGSEVDPAEKDRRILAPCCGATARFGAAVEAPTLAPELVSRYDRVDRLEEYWRCLAHCRFLLVPWERPHDSPAPFEALILGTIPILRIGPLAEAYHGLPVVTVRDISEINAKKLDEWWEMYAGGFADPAITSPAYWWAKVATRLPDHERAFPILGPGSSGNHHTRRQRPREASLKTFAAARPFADFAEWWFPSDVSVRLAYENRVEAGRERMRSSSVVFCGLARDVADILPLTAARIERAGEMFGDYRVVIYENDSRDGTVARLGEWQNSNSRVDVLSETLGAVRWGRSRDPARMRHLAACRNRYLDHAKDRYGAFDFLIVLDTDLPRGFSYDGLAHTFGGEGWDVVGSNSLSVLPEGFPPPGPEFFDAWAFRWPGDLAPRPFAEINALSFQRGEPLVPVWSAFGGLAVYAMAAIRSGARYGGDDCEHVVLHRRLCERGFERQFLNPSQIVLYVEGPS